MKVLPTVIADVIAFEPPAVSDERGSFCESFNQREFEDMVGRPLAFVQDNQSISKRAVLRGLHYQMKQTQGKLVRVVEGAVVDVAVDLRRSSPSFGQHVLLELSAENRLQMWIPAGFAHGFLVLSESATVLYKVTDYYHPASEKSLLWNDLQLAIPWPTQYSAPLLSQRDSKASSFAQAILAGDVFD